MDTIAREEACRPVAVSSIRTPLKRTPQLRGEGTLSWEAMGAFECLRAESQDEDPLGLSERRERGSSDGEVTKPGQRGWATGSR